MNKKIVRISTICMLISVCAFAQKKANTVIPNELDEIVISDSKFDLPKEKSGKVIVKITAQDLAKKSGQSLATILSSVVGLEVNGNQSNAGKNVSYYIRGARSRQTLIIIDGIPVSDASGINLDYDLRLIPIEQVESIEIMKGAASTLYGSGAAAGVINITLKKGTKKSISGNVYMNTGSQSTSDVQKHTPQEFNQGFNFGGKSEKMNYYAALNSSAATGISEAKGASFEPDAFDRVNSIVKLGFTPTQKLSLDFFANYDRMRNEFDSGAFADNPDNYNISEQYRVGFSPKYKYNKGEVVLNTSGNLINRELNQFGGVTNYKSRNFNSDLFNKYAVNSELFIVAGTQFQFHEMSIASQYLNINNSIAKFNFIDPYLNLVYNSKFGFNLNTGARLNIHSNYGNHIVYNVNPSYNFSTIPLKLISSYSTAYITPSLYQLYDGYAGNLNLKPEENTTVEAGFQVKLLQKRITINAVSFYREEKSAIEYYSNPMTYEASYFNANGKYNAKGFETMFDFTLTEKIHFNANYSFTETEQKVVNNTFPDVKANLYNPKHKVNAGIDYQFVERGFLGISYQYLDKRYGFSGYPPVISSLAAYQLVNASAKYDLIKDRMTIFGAITNIFNEEFVENVGFNTRGRNFKVGFTILF